MKPAQIPLTLGLIAFSVLIFLLFELWNSDLVLDYFFISLSDSTDWAGLTEISSGQIWRLVSPIFLHFSIIHIVFNMLGVYLLGGVIEILQGKLLLVLLVILTAVVSNLIQYFVAGSLFGGMSGVVYALFGYIWVQGLTNDKFGYQLMKPLVVLMLGSFVVTFFVSWIGAFKLFNVSIANTAHTAGLLSGIILGADTVLNNALIVISC